MLTNFTFCLFSFFFLMDSLVLTHHLLRLKCALVAPDTGSLGVPSIEKTQVIIVTLHPKA